MKEEWKLTQIWRVWWWQERRGHGLGGCDLQWHGKRERSKRRKGGNVGESDQKGYCSDGGRSRWKHWMAAFSGWRRVIALWRLILCLCLQRPKGYEGSSLLTSTLISLHTHRDREGETKNATKIKVTTTSGVRGVCCCHLWNFWMYVAVVEVKRVRNSHCLHLHALSLTL